MTEAPSADTEQREQFRQKVEHALVVAPAWVVRRRFNLTEGELHDLCPDMVDDEPATDRSAVSGY